MLYPDNPCGGYPFVVIWCVRFVLWSVLTYSISTPNKSQQLETFRRLNYSNINNFGAKCILVVTVCFGLPPSNRMTHVTVTVVNGSITFYIQPSYMRMCLHGVFPFPKLAKILQLSGKNKHLRIQALFADFNWPLFLSFLNLLPLLTFLLCILSHYTKKKINWWVCF